MNNTYQPIFGYIFNDIQIFFSLITFVIAYYFLIFKSLYDGEIETKKEFVYKLIWIYYSIKAFKSLMKKIGELK